MEEKLWKACEVGKVEDVPTLLQNEYINVNWPEPKYSMTPFYIACENGHLEIVKMLLNDQRVDINKAFRVNVKTPLQIAQQRAGSTRKFGFEPDEQFQRAKRNCPKIVELIESFQRDPTETRAKLRKELAICKIFLFLFFHILID